MGKTFFLGKVLTCGIVIILMGTSMSSGIDTAKKPLIPSSMSTTNDRCGTSPTSVPNEIEIGDLILVDLRLDQSRPWKRPGLYNEHCAIYIGNDTLIEANGVVRYRNYTQFAQWGKNYIILRVKTATESQRLAAVEWAKSKIGTAYQVFFDFPCFGLKIANTTRPFPTANELYCVELLWAAYYLQGIDIDYNGWKFPWWITPNDVLADDDVEVLFRDVTNSTEITKPDKGFYAVNKKISVTVFNTVVLGPIDIEVSTENVNITKVDFFIDSIYKANDTTPPYAWRWIERGSGKKIILVIASDDAGNQYSTRNTVWKFF